VFPLKDTVPRREAPFVVWALIAANALVFFFERSLPGPVLVRFIELFGVVPARYTSPEWASAVGLQGHNYWPFLTYMFLHGGWLHIIGNMWFLWIFGDNVEDRMGHRRFLFFYLLCGFSAVLIYLIINPESTVPTLGASGAISGVMGAYFLMFPTARVLTLIPIFFFPYIVELPALIFIGFWFLFQLISGASSMVEAQTGQGIAWWAHIGGFITGMVLLPLFKRSTKAHRPYFPDERMFR
jgi:membrane associated rhomboid family serine protease